MKNTDPKCKQCRRIGEKLFFKGERCSSPKCAIIRRNYIPGFHGPKAKGAPRRSDYGLQLVEKQKAKKQYLLNEKQFRILFEIAAKKRGNTEELLLQLLELRLDNVVYRAAFGASRNEARQLVNHGHFTVNGKRVDIPSYKVKQGDVVKLSEKSKRGKKFANLEAKIKKAEIPGWLNVNAEDLSVKVLHEPAAKDIRVNFSPQVIVEFYSR
ncbi:MAG TPA: 30S ribosomal protein S4 [Candidatus Nanoarchaeia archaeon]|nr:30S ribosomal protein S4 [Candidatus Nanoarchaeia archaeon]